MATLVIVGRPNVGKSTLFNRLVGKRLALVDNTPGVTRDRREGEARLGDLRFRIIDTAGFERGDPFSLVGRMRAQTEAALRQADGVLFVIDAAAGLAPEDSAFADLIRRAGKPVILVANKTDVKAASSGVYESFALGLGDPVAISAEHGEGLTDLYDAVGALVAERPSATDAESDSRPRDEPAREAAPDEGDGSEFDAAKPLRIAVVGRPNVGKSTLINRLLGEERLLTGPEAGMTRDSIAVDFAWSARDGQKRNMKLFDTAGLRKKARVADKLEKLAVSDALRAIAFAEVVILMIDATTPFEKQDLAIADLIAREGRGLVFALGKWDLVAHPGSVLKELRAMSDRLLPQVRGAPAIPVSGLTGAGCDRLMTATLEVEQLWNQRIGTGRLNRWLEQALERTPPPAVAGRRIRIRYMTQAKARPPHFVIFGNQLAALPTSYERYLVNSLRDAFDLPGVPIRLTRRQSDNPYARERSAR